ncbi:MAG: RimK family alpha-L-glutamate ligase [Deltaproteobacteria bacterium]|nr:RimK family alpha-L-glutamate ligase [Deltaproteobacteria bacterium]
MPGPFVAIGRRLARFPWITTLGPRPNLLDYPPEHLALIRRASTVYYPTGALAVELAVTGQRIFPSLACHLLEGDKIRQTSLFNLLGLPHPRTRVYYGRQRSQVLDDFDFPFIAKTPRGSALGRGVFLIQDEAGLAAYLDRHDPAYLQEYLPVTEEVRVVLVGYEVLCAYRRLAAVGEFRANLARGGDLDFEGVPPAAVDLAARLAREASLDEVGVDVALAHGQPYLLEFNVKYGWEGPKRVGIDPAEYVAERIREGRL